MFWAGFFKCKQFTKGIRQQRKYLLNFGGEFKTNNLVNFWSILEAMEVREGTNFLVLCESWDQSTFLEKKTGFWWRRLLFCVVKPLYSLFWAILLVLGPGEALRSSFHSFIALKSLLNTFSALFKLFSPNLTSISNKGLPKCLATINHVMSSMNVT